MILTLNGSNFFNGITENGEEFFTKSEMTIPVVICHGTNKKVSNGKFPF